MLEKVRLILCTSFHCQFQDINPSHPLLYTSKRPIYIWCIYNVQDVWNTYCIHYCLKIRISVFYVACRGVFVYVSFFKFIYVVFDSIWLLYYFSFFCYCVCLNIVVYVRVFECMYAWICLISFWVFRCMFVCLSVCICKDKYLFCEEEY